MTIFSKKSDKAEARTLTATAVAKEFGIKAKELNLALESIGFLKRSSTNGWTLTEKAAKLGTQKVAIGSQAEYVVWKEFILSNNALKKALADRKTTTTVVNAPVVATTPAKPNFKDTRIEIDGVKFFDRRALPAEFRTEQGFYVRSRAEVIVADWFYRNNIVIAYEKRLPISANLYSDFYIPEFDIYVEFWGYENDKKYVERKTVKKKLYKDNGFDLLELSDDDLQILDDTLPTKMLSVLKARNSTRDRGVLGILRDAAAGK